MNYEIKNLKTLNTHDGLAFTLTLYKNGKRIGTAENAGRGGCNLYRIKNSELQEFARFAATKVGSETIEPEDAFLEILMNEFFKQKQLKAQSKKNTLFRVKGEKAGGFRTVNIPFEARALDFLKSKYGSELELVLDRNAKPVAI